MFLSTILAISVAFATIFSASTNAFNFPLNALETGENTFKIELIDVKCDKNENGMQVSIEFSQPFDGIIYSQGYFNDPKCRYISAGEHELMYNFVVPYEGCGSKRSCAICDSMDNILIIQQDEEVQGEFDAARKISCSRTGLEDEKKILFKPFIVDMLDVVTVPTSHGDVDCWMDIQRGIYPKLKPVGEVIKIGEALTVLVYLRDAKNEYDLSVRNCWAYDNEDFDDKNTGKVQLSDSSGCTMKRKLFGSWAKTHETGKTGATLLLHNTLRAFKFPDESQVYLRCDIEICRGNCAEAICDLDEIKNVDCTLDPLHEKCIRNKLIDRNKSPLVGFTTLASTKVHVPSSTSEITARVPLIETTRRPSFVFSTTQRQNYVPTTVFNQDITTFKPFRCTSDSKDIRCIQNRFAETTQAPEITTIAREANTYPNLFKTTSMKPGLESFCKQYPKHKRCNQRVTEEISGNIEILTFKPPSPFATVKYIPTTALPSESLKESTERKLDLFYTTELPEIDEQPLNCKGAILDPRCPNPTPTATPPTYLPPSTTMKLTTTRCYPGSPDPRCPRIDIISTRQPFIKQTTKKFFICVPGSNDVNCDIETTKRTDKPPIQETTPFVFTTTTKQPEKPICFIGSRNPECQKVSTNILTYKPTPSTTAIPPTTIRQFISTTRAPLCYPGSLDPRCPKITTTERIIPSISTTQEVRTEFPTTTKRIIPEFMTRTVTDNDIIFPTTTIPPRCYPGSFDPRCPQQFTTKRVIPEITTTQRVVSRFPEITTRTVTERPETTTFTFKTPSTTRAPLCYPGSLDPRCVKLITERIVATNIPTISSTIPSVPFTTRTPICYLGSPDPRCAKQTTTKRVIPEITTTQRIVSRFPETSTINVPISTRGPTCYPGALDPRCSSTTQRAFPSISTTQEVRTELPTTTKRIIPEVTTRRVTERPETTSFTFRTPSTTGGPRCYPGSLDPRCPKLTTTRIIPSISTTQEVPTTTTASLPRCYPGSLDSRCVQTTVKPFTTTKLSPSEKVISTTFRPIISTTKSQTGCNSGSLDPACNSVVPLQCGPGGYIDPRCPNPTPTAEPATYLPPTTPSSLKTTKPPIITTTQRFITTPKIIPSISTEAFPKTTTRFTTRQPVITQRPIYTTKPPFSLPTVTTRAPVVTTTFIPKFTCTPNSLDPRCITFTTQKTIPTGTTEDLRTPATESPETTTRFVATTTTQRPPITITQRPTYTTTKPPISFPTITTRTPIITSSQFTCTPNSLDPRCRTIITSTPGYSTERLITESPETTTKIVTPFVTTRVPSSTIVPKITTTKPPYSFPTFSTTRPIMSSPQPFTTRRPTEATSTTTENIFCYPGSTIEGCKQTITTPSFCYPGSKDKRCPQLPPSFSTRQPATYLPPYPDEKLNRVKREASIEQSQEIVTFSLSFKPFSFS